jgi:cob(I)alamin adenosyltransferase
MVQVVECLPTKFKALSSTVQKIRNMTEVICKLHWKLFFVGIILLRADDISSFNIDTEDNQRLHSRTDSLNLTLNNRDQIWSHLLHHGKKLYKCKNI